MNNHELKQEEKLITKIRNCSRTEKILMISEGFFYCLSVGFAIRTAISIANPEYLCCQISHGMSSAVWLTFGIMTKKERKTLHK